MFMHIGNDLVIESKQIIAILEMELVHQSEKLQATVQEKKANKQIFGSNHDAKSMIITDEGIYYSPLSTMTLKNRDELYQTIS